MLHSVPYVDYYVLFIIIGRYRAKKMYEEEMKRGHSKRRITKLVMIGTAGSGKTTSLVTVLEEQPPAEEDRTSTPLLKRPVQTEVVYVKDKVMWQKKNPKQKRQHIANLLRARAQRLHRLSTESETAPSSQTQAPSAPILPQSTENKLTDSNEQNPLSYTSPGENVTLPASKVPIVTSERYSHSAVKINSLLELSEEDDEMISLINIPNDVLESILEEECVYIVDSGGQPEFVDAMTVFLRKTSACALVIDLSQSLDHRPLIGYFRRGKAISKPYYCSCTNEDNLKRSMRTVYSFSSKKKTTSSSNLSTTKNSPAKEPPTKLLFLGTHLDKVGEHSSESIAEKDKRIRQLIPSKFKSQVISYSKEKLIFDMNALHPDATDRKTADKLRLYIVEQCPKIEVDVPIRWHMFEDKLRSIAEGLGRQVMSCGECSQVAKFIGLNEASYNASLDFFHDVSLIFYFRDILPDVVFIDPQVILDKVSELIEFMFELRQPDEPTFQTEDNVTPDANATSHDSIISPCDSSLPKTVGAKSLTITPPTPSATKALEKSREIAPSLHPPCKSSPETPYEKPITNNEQEADTETDLEMLPAGWQQFEQFGLVTKPFLEDKRFSDHYHTGVFTSDDTIKLLEELLVFAKQLTEDELETWFMPSVLRQISTEDLAKVCVSGAGALVVDFPEGGPQSGIFCSLMSHLLSTANHNPCPWKLHLSSDDEPACLYRDCVQFEVPKFAGSITLIDRCDYFEVHVFTSAEDRHDLWKYVQEALFRGIEVVCDTLGYSGNEPRAAILCPKSHTEKAHPAYLKNEKQWICTRDSHQFGYLQDVSADIPWCNVTCPRKHS